MSLLRLDTGDIFQCETHRATQRVSMRRTFTGCFLGGEGVLLGYDTTLSTLWKLLLQISEKSMCILAIQVFALSL